MSEYKKTKKTKGGRGGRTASIPEHMALMEGEDFLACVVALRTLGADAGSKQTSINVFKTVFVSK